MAAGTYRDGCWRSSALTAVVAGLALVGGGSARADIIHVPDDYATIQGAIDASLDGYEIIVAEGEYLEKINLKGKAITLRSSDPLDAEVVANTIINGSSSGSVVTCSSGEGPDTIIDGFSITGGTGTKWSYYLCGGGMYNDNSSATVVHCIFMNNAADMGGGMFNLTSSPHVSNCTFIANTVVGNGGGMNNWSSSSPVVVDCIFSDNACGHVGGAVGNRQDCHPFFVNCSFIGNSASDMSGAIRAGNTGTSPTVINCLFVQNSSEVGGAYSAGTDNPGTIGHSLIVNCIFRDNQADLGPQIALNGLFPADITVEFSNVEGGEADVYVEDGFTLTWGPGNIDADPLFVAPGSDDFRLGHGSPCIDAGNNDAVPDDITADLDGNPRFVDDPDTEDTGVGTPPIVDMGCYEFQVSLECPADVTGDGVVDVLDLLEVLAQWGTSGSADINGDGIVDVLDLLKLLGLWGPCPPNEECLADLNCDDMVDVLGLLQILAHWGPCP